MKKAISIVISMVLVLSLFASCSKGNSTEWNNNVNDTFKDVAVYKYGDTISAEFASNCNIKIKDSKYKNFVKYIEDLKAAGFEYLKNGDIPENYSLTEGQANWRCTNGKVYLQLIFNEDGSTNYDMFGCNVQIYGYDQKPESWGESSKEEKKDKKKDKKETKSQKKQKTEKTTAAVQTTTASK